MRFCENLDFKIDFNASATDNIDKDTSEIFQEQWPQFECLQDFTVCFMTKLDKNGIDSSFFYALGYYHGKFAIPI